MTREEAIAVLKNTAWLGTEKTLQKVEQAIETLEPKTASWMPVTERLPEIPKGIKEYINFEKEKDVAAEEYIVMIKGAKKPTTLYWTEDGEWWDLDNRDQYDVTAWMPLPDPYEEI